MEFLVLGPMEIRDGRRRVAAGGPQAEKALAALLLARGRVVGVATLVDVLWDGAPPRTATHQVHKLIAGLRRRIPGTIETDGGGYRFRLGPNLLDADRFLELSGGSEIPQLTAALALWRGPALTGMDSRALRTEAAALEDRRLLLVQRLTDLRTAAGPAGG